MKFWIYVFRFPYAFEQFLPLLLIVFFLIVEKQPAKVSKPKTNDGDDDKTKKMSLILFEDVRPFVDYSIFYHMFWVFWITSFTLFRLILYLKKKMRDSYQLSPLLFLHPSDLSFSPLQIPKVPWSIVLWIAQVSSFHFHVLPT